MKKIFKQMLAAILAMATVFSMCVFASANEIEGSWWSLNMETGHLTVHCNVPYNDNLQGSELLRYIRYIKSVSFDEGVTAVNKNGFNRCSKIERIELPKSLEFIGPWAFAGCASLKEIVFPDSLTYIGYNSFANCASLESIVIPPRVTVVTEYAFYNCKSLESVEITNAKTAVDDYAFGRNNALKTVKFPENADIDPGTFKDSDNIEKVYYSGDEESYNELKIVKSPDNPFFFAEVFYNQPVAVYPVGFSVFSMPERLIYVLNEDVDLTGLELEVEMTDGTVEKLSDISEIKVRYFDSSYLGEHRFTIEYFGYSAYVYYTVIEAFSGVCGNPLRWKFDVESRTLEFFGGNRMYNYNMGANAPWYEFRDLIKTVKFSSPISVIGEDAFKDCDQIEAVYYRGSILSWRRITGDKEQFGDAKLYIQNKLHEHSYDYNIETTKASCVQDGESVYHCECGYTYSEILPVVDHVSGDWETDFDGKTVKKCTMCGKVTEIKAEEPEETPDEEITQPDTEPETGKDAQIEEESKNAVTEIFEAITSFFKNIFVNNPFADFFANLFK